MPKQDLGKPLGKCFGASVAWRKGGVDRMGGKEVLLELQGFLYSDFVLNIKLRSALNTDVTKLHLNFLTQQHFSGIGTFIHNINLGNNTKSSDTIRVFFVSKLDSI